MKIIDYDNRLDKKQVADKAYRICDRAEFPVTYQDVYDHLFTGDNLILKLLLDGEENIAGFGVFEYYDKIFTKSDLVTMLYLSGIVIDPNYQGKNVLQEIIKAAYKPLLANLITLRTQNIAMATSLLNVYSDNLMEIPGSNNEELLNYLRQVEHFKNINDNGVIKGCYPNQIYSNLNAIKNRFGIELTPNDALAVVIEPGVNRTRTSSKFKR